MTGDKAGMVPAGRRRWLGLVTALLAVGGAVTLQATRRHASSPVWTEIGADDPRVAGVIQTLQRRGLSAALDSLEHQAERDSLVLRAGHQLAHALGRRAFALSGGSDSVIARCSAAFGSGCYHGVVEASLAGRHAVDMGALERMCARADDPSHSGSLYECVHGVGHGVLGAVGGIAEALHDCDALSVEALRGSCHEGVFMEAFTSALSRGEHAAGHSHAAGHAGHVTSFSLSPGDPYSPCRAYQSAYGEACWLFQGFVILRRVHFDAGRALETCDQAPAAWVERCYQSVGHQLTGLFQRDDQWVIERCRTGRTDQQPQCAAGAVLARIAADWTGGRARAFCARVPPSWREDCRRTYERRMAAMRSGSRSG